MTFTGHLEELRRRLLVCVLSLLVGMGISYAFHDELFAFVLHPLFVARGAGTSPESRSVAAPEPAQTSGEVAREARALSKRALEASDCEQAARLAAEAADRASKAVLLLEASEQRRADEETVSRQRSIAYTSPAKPFWVSLQLSMVGGLCLAFGVILWQIWRFVAPGLYPGEKRYALPFIVSATLCFVGGAAFSYRYVFPVGFGYFVRFSRQISEAQGIAMMDMTTVDEFVSIALKLLLGFGLVFELPVVVSFLALVGIVDHKQLWRFGRWFVVIATIVAAVLTPPDVVSQIMMAVPLIVLYFVSIGLAYFLHPSRRKRRGKGIEDEQEEAADSSEEEPAG